MKIHKTEEKGSDVNLACHLLLDAFQNKFDVGVVISNGSDLVEPIRIATQELGKIVELLSPAPNPNPQLIAVSSLLRRIEARHAISSQFPNPITIKDGSKISKPPSWN